MLLKASVLWPMKSRPMGSWSQTRKRTSAISGICTVNTSVSSHMGLNPRGHREEGSPLTPVPSREATWAHALFWCLGRGWPLGG